MAQIARREALRLAAALRGTRERQSPQLMDEDLADDRPMRDDPEQMIDLGRAMVALTERDRTLLELRYVDDLTVPVIARVLGVPEGTIKARLHRLRRQLGSELGEAS